MRNRMVSIALRRILRPIAQVYPIVAATDGSRVVAACNFYIVAERESH